MLTKITNKAGVSRMINLSKILDIEEIMYSVHSTTLSSGRCDVTFEGGIGTCTVQYEGFVQADFLPEPEPQPQYDADYDDWKGGDRLIDVSDEDLDKCILVDIAALGRIRVLWDDKTFGYGGYGVVRSDRFKRITNGR